MFLVIFYPVLIFSLLSFSRFHFTDCSRAFWVLFALGYCDWSPTPTRWYRLPCCKSVHPSWRSRPKPTARSKRSTATFSTCLPSGCFPTRRLSLPSTTGSTRTYNWTPTSATLLSSALASWLSWNGACSWSASTLSPCSRHPSVF